VVMQDPEGNEFCLDWRLGGAACRLAPLSCYRRQGSLDRRFPGRL